MLRPVQLNRSLHVEVSAYIQDIFYVLQHIKNIMRRYLKCVPVSGRVVRQSNYYCLTQHKNCFEVADHDWSLSCICASPAIKNEAIQEYLCSAATMEELELAKDRLVFRWRSASSRDLPWRRSE